MRRNSRWRRGAIVVVMSCATAACAVGAYVANGAVSVPEPSPAAVFKASPSAGPGRLAKAYGLDPDDERYVFTLGNAEGVAILAGANAACLMRSEDAGSGETCETVAAIDRGQAVWVEDECGAAGDDRMEIIGIAPAGASSATLNYSAGPSQSADVVSGAFKFEGTNPAQGAAYPTTIDWLTDDGSSLGTAHLPVTGDEFCLPTE
jgi:hypothetical protein